MSKKKANSTKALNNTKLTTFNEKTGTLAFHFNSKYQNDNWVV